MQQVLKDVLKVISPSKKERERVKSLIDAFIDKLKKLSLPHTSIILGGSAAKDTWLAGAHDADIFISFDYETYKKRNLSNLLESQLKKITKEYERVHGSRDYFQLQQKEFMFELVPILAISKAEQAVNITDVSVLHSKWVRRQSKPALRDQIRLAKAFCKSQSIYGAESYINGFSGYVLEILTIHYGGFEKLLKASRKWKVSQVIDTAKLYKSTLDAKHGINRSKHGPLIIVDPVDASRNAAAALSKEKIEVFRQVAASFLKKASTDYFTKAEVSKEILQAQYPNALIIEVEPTKGKRDVVGSKLLKIFDYVSKELELFCVEHKGWQWNHGENALMWWATTTQEIEPVEIRQGPPLRMEEGVKRFKKTHKDVFEKKGVMYARVKRKHTKLTPFAKDLLKKEYVKERVKKIIIL